MDSQYRFLKLGIPWAHSMSSRDVNTATRLAEASWRRDKLAVCLVVASHQIISICDHDELSIYLIQYFANLKQLTLARNLHG